MTESELRDKWWYALGQAESFTRVDQPNEAYARARAVLSEIEAAFAERPELATGPLKSAKALAQDYVVRFEKARDEWAATIRARQTERYNNEISKLEGPMPIPPPPAK